MGLDNQTITQEELKKLVNYNPETGVFTWAYSRGGASKGVVCGSVNRYVTIMLNRKDYSAHRLAFLYMTGSMPDHEVDHINHIKTDNRWLNLRSVKHSSNQKNKPLHKNNASGTNGVSWIASAKRWYAYIMVKNKSINLGVYKNKEDAIKARLDANKKYCFHENHGSPSTLGDRRVLSSAS